MIVAAFVADGDRHTGSVLPGYSTSGGTFAPLIDDGFLRALVAKAEIHGGLGSLEGIAIRTFACVLMETVVPCTFHTSLHFGGAQTTLS